MRPLSTPVYPIFSNVVPEFLASSHLYLEYEWTPFNSWHSGSQNDIYADKHFSFSFGDTPIEGVPSCDKTKSQYSSLTGSNIGTHLLYLFSIDIPFKPNISLIINIYKKLNSPSNEKSYIYRITDKHDSNV